MKTFVSRSCTKKHTLMLCKSAFLPSYSGEFARWGELHTFVSVSASTSVTWRKSVSIRVFALTLYVVAPHEKVCFAFGVNTAKQIAKLTYLPLSVTFPGSLQGEELTEVILKLLWAWRDPSGTSTRAWPTTRTSTASAPTKPWR